MCLLFSKITIEFGHLVLTSMTVLLAVFAFVWNFNQARKSDFKELMGRKADGEVVKREFKLMDEKIKAVKDLQAQQNEFVKEKIEELHSTMESGLRDVKELIKRISA